MDTTVAQPTWWTLPEVQQNFYLVADVEAQSMRAKNFTTADFVNAVVLSSRSMGTTRRRALVDPVAGEPVVQVDPAEIES